MRCMILVLASLLGVVNAATIEHWWNISYAEANPDGVSIDPLPWSLRVCDGPDSSGSTVADPSSDRC
jgi:hypothetical protein